MKKIILVFFVIIAKTALAQQIVTEKYSPVQRICSQYNLTREQALVVKFIYLNDWSLLKRIESDTAKNSTTKKQLFLDLKKNAFNNGKKLFSEDLEVRILAELVWLTGKGKILQDSILNHNSNLVRHPLKGAHFKSDTVIKYNTTIKSN